MVALAEAAASTRDGPPLLPYSVLLRVGFTLPRSVTTLAVSSYLTFSPLPSRLAEAQREGGLFSVALSLGSLPVDVIHHTALRSPDFPRPDSQEASEETPGRDPVLY